MNGYRNLGESRAGRIARMVAGMCSCADLAELEDRFISDALKVLPGDCLAWNNWAPDWGTLLSGRLNEGYHEEFHHRLEAFGETVGYHPVVMANQFHATTSMVMKLTDFQPASKFAGNPLYCEVYRHIDSRFQLAFTPCHLSDRRVLLTLNRNSGDFSEEDREGLHYAGMCLDGIARAIEERQAMGRVWRELCAFAGGRTGIGPFNSLGDTDLRVLAGLLKRRSVSEISASWEVRRDTLDKRLGSIRERLGVENNRQLLSALAELRPAVPGGDRGPA